MNVALVPAPLFRPKVSDLARTLERPDTRTEAAESIRGLIDAIVLTPTRSPETGDLELRIAMVAGGRNPHHLQLWRPAA